MEILRLTSNKNSLPEKSFFSCQLTANAGIYVFHTWSFCAGRKTSTIGLFELFIIVICWIFCAYSQILNRDVEDFCVHAQKFLIMTSDNKVFQHWIICAYMYTQILNRDVENFCVHAQKFLIMISDNKVFQHWIICAYTQILNRDVEDFCVHAQKFLIMISDNKVFQRWIICAYTQILNKDVENFCVHAQKFQKAILDIQNHY